MSLSWESETNSEKARTDSPFQNPRGELREARLSEVECLRPFLKNGVVLDTVPKILIKEEVRDPLLNAKVYKTVLERARPDVQKRQRLPINLEKTPSTNSAYDAENSEKCYSVLGEKSSYSLSVAKVVAHSDERIFEVSPPTVKSVYLDRLVNSVDRSPRPLSTTQVKDIASGEPKPLEKNSSAHHGHAVCSELSSSTSKHMKRQTLALKQDESPKSCLSLKASASAERVGESLHIREPQRSKLFLRDAFSLAFGISLSESSYLVESYHGDLGPIRRHLVCKAFKKLLGKGEKD